MQAVALTPSAGEAPIAQSLIVYATSFTTEESVFRIPAAFKMSRPTLGSSQPHIHRAPEASSMEVKCGVRS